MHTDEELVKRMQEAKETGDEQTYDPAFDQLFAKYSLAIRNYCTKLLNNKDEGEQAAQDAFLRLHENIGKFRGDCSFKSWIFRLAKNACANITRAAKMTTVSIQDDANAKIAERPDTKTRVENSVIAAAAVEAVKVRMEERDALDQTIFQLYLVEELSFVQIARKLNRPESTIKTRYARLQKQVFQPVASEFGEE